MQAKEPMAHQVLLGTEESVSAFTLLEWPTAMPTAYY